MTANLHPCSSDLTGCFCQLSIIAACFTLFSLTLECQFLFLVTLSGNSLRAVFKVYSSRESWYLLLPGT